MAKKLVDLSYTYHEGMPAFAAYWHPTIEITQLGHHESEGRETRKIVMGTHHGTHLDAPRHFIPQGDTVDKLPIEIFVGPAFVVDFSYAKPLQEIQVEDFQRQLEGKIPERIIMRFDWSDKWGTDKFYSENPYISNEAAKWLVANKVKLLGMDTPQADSPQNGRDSANDSPVHKILLGGGVIKLEYLTNLKQVGRGLIDLIALPLKIQEADGAPVRCVTWVEY